MGLGCSNRAGRRERNPTGSLAKTNDLNTKEAAIIGAVQGLNRYKPFGTTADVDFKTTKPCFPAVVSHINQVVADTQQWEQSAAFRLEMAAR